jgi:tRNA A-37 threonylcarbamoyl transferase component Bud32
MATEARTMEYARSNGYPVPEVVEISGDGTDLVMERVDGPSMLSAVSRQPWTLSRQGKLLADLHRRLHEIPAPDWTRDSPCGKGDRLIHLDLHPLNVILSGRGPIVIDWSNASRGDGDTDVALTWLLLAAAGIPAGRAKAAILSRGRGFFVKAFLNGFDLAEVKEHLPEVVAWKVRDPHMSAAEQGAMWSLLQRLQASDS